MTPRRPASEVSAAICAVEWTEVCVTIATRSTRSLKRSRAASCASDSTRRCPSFVVVRRCSRDMVASLFHPFIGVRITRKVKKPAQEGETVAAPKTEPGCVRSERIGECSRIIVAAANGIGDKLSDGIRVFTVVQKIRGDARWACYRHAGELYVLVWLESPGMKPYVRSSGLAPLRYGELVSVGGQVAEPIQRRSRSVRDNALIRGSLPGRNSGCKLKPCCP